MTILEFIIIAVIVVKVIIPWLQKRNEDNRLWKSNIEFLKHEDLRDYYRDH